MKNKIRSHLKRHYGMYIIITNIMIAVGTAAFAVLGLLSDMLSIPVLFGNAAVFGLMFVIGKFGNEQLEDIPKVEDMEDVCSKTTC